MTRAALFLALFALVPAAPAAAKKAAPKKDPAPVLVDFEAGEVGKADAAWFGPAQSDPDNGYHAAISDVSPHGGKRALMLESFGSPEWGANSYKPDPAPYRGRIVRFRAWLRYEGEGSAGLWFRVDRPKDAKGPRGFFANTQGNPIKSSTWVRVELIGEVADDAERVLFGGLIWGKGKSWIDDATIEILAVPPAEGPSPLTGRALENVVAFSRLLGYVRHFHPSDQAEQVDWDQFAIVGMRAVEKAKDAKALSKVLAKLFAPVAPSVSVFATGKAPKPASPPKGATRVTWWEHHGFGDGDKSGDDAYHSDRKWGDLKDGKLPEGVPASEPLRFDLGGGVSADVPIVVYADAKGTLPAVKKSKKAGDDGTYETSHDRATRLAGVALAWNVFQHFYPYFDVVQVDWAAALPEALAGAANAADDSAYYTVLALLVAKLQDGHGNVVSIGRPPPFRPPIMWDVIEGKLVVTLVKDGVEGVKRGDVVVTIDGRAAADALDAAGKDISAATPQYLRWHAVRALGAGDQGTSVELEIERGGARSKVTLARSSTPWEMAEPRPEPIADIKPGIVYVDLTRINQKEWTDALPRLAKAKGVLLDMRGYPGDMQPAFLGNLIDKPIDSAKWRIPIVTKPDRVDLRFSDDHWSVDPDKPRLKGKVAFLTHGQAISYAETVMGMVESYKIGLIVGEATAGTNGNVNPFTLPGGNRITWTGMQVLKHDGSRHHGVGIQPTHPVARTIAGVTAGRDEVLQAACRLVEK